MTIEYPTNYIIITHKSDDRPVIQSLNYMSTLSRLPCIQANLKDIEYSGDVIFDLLTSNSFTSNRFVQGYFDGCEFDLAEFSILDRVQEDLLTDIYTLYAEIANGVSPYVKLNPCAIDLHNSVLSPAHIYFLKEFNGNLYDTPEQFRKWAVSK